MKMVYALALAVVLAGCGQGQSTQGQSASEQAPPAATASQVESKPLCPEPMAINAEQYFMNLDAGLKAINQPTQVNDKKLDANDCGYQLVMLMKSGAIQMQLDAEQRLLNLGAGYENTQQPVDNMSNLFTIIQSIVALHGTERMGESKVGTLLFNTVTETMEAAVNGSGTAAKDVELDGFLYTVAVEGKAVATLARKKI